MQSSIFTCPRPRPEDERNTVDIFYRKINTDDLWQPWNLFPVHQHTTLNMKEVVTTVKP